MGILVPEREFTCDRTGFFVPTLGRIRWVSSRPARTALIIFISSILDALSGCKRAAPMPVQAFGLQRPVGSFDNALSVASGPTEVDLYTVLIRP